MATNETSIIISAVDKTGDAIRTAGGGLDKLATSATNLSGTLAGLAGGAAIGVFAGMIRNAIDAADGLNDLSKSTSIAVETLAGLDLASKQSGAELEGTAQAINRLSVNMGKNAEAFAAIGVTAKEPLEAFKQLSDVFSKIEDPQLKAAVAAEALGKSWASAAPLLAEGGQRIQEMVDKGSQLAGVTQGMADDADAFNDVLEEWKAALGGVATRIASDLLPIMKAMSADMDDATGSAGDMAGSLSPLAEVFRVLVVVGGSAAYMFRSVGREIGGIAAQMASVSRGDFAGAFAIGRAMKEDADVSRAAFVQWERGVLSAQKTAVKAKEAVEGLTEAQKKAAQAFASTSNTDKDAAEARRAAAAARLAAKAGKAAADAEQERLFARAEQMAAISKAVDGELKAMAEAREDYAKSVAALLGPIEDEAASLERQVETYGLTRAEIEATTIARLEEAKAMLAGQVGQEDNIAFYEREIAARKRIRDASLNLEAKEAATDAAKKAAAEWERTADKIGDSITDALMRGFESGKDFAQNLRDTVVNMFKTMILQPTIKAVVVGGLSTLGMGAAQADTGIAGIAGAGGSGSLSNLASLGSSAYDMVAGGGSLYESFALSGAGSALGLSTGLSTSLGVAGGAGSVMGGSAALAAAEATSIGGATALSGIGSAIGAALPVIGVIGAIAGLSGLFGSKPKIPKMNLANMEVPGWGNFDTPFGKISGAAKHDDNFAKTFDSLKPIAEADKLIAAQLSAAEMSAAKAAIFGTGTGEIKSKRAGGAIDNFIADRLDRITDVIGGWVNDLGDTVTGDMGKIYSETAAILAARRMDGAEALARELLSDEGKAFYRESATAAAAFARMAGALQLINPLLKGINQVAFAMSGLGGNFATDLLAKFASPDVLAQQVGGYYDAFFSDTEKQFKQLDALNEIVAKSFGEIGVAVPATNAAFRALVESLDLTTDSGQKTFASLMGVSGAFAQAQALQAQTQANIEKTLAESKAKREKEMFDNADAAYAGLERAIEAEKKRIDSAYEAQTKAMQASADAASEIQSSLTSLADTLKGAVRSVVAESDALTLSRRVAAQNTLNTALSAAQSGQSLVPFADSITDAITDLSSPSEQLYATFEDYARAQGQANAALSALQTNALAQKSVATLTLEALNKSIEAAGLQHDEDIARLDQLLDGAKSQLDALKGIDTSVLSVAEALKNFQSAVGGNAAKSAGSSVAATSPGNAAIQAVADYGKQYGDNAYYLMAGVNDYTAKLASATAMAAALGTTIADAAVWSDGKGQAYWQEVQRQYDAGLHPTTTSIRGFAIGTNYVPYDMTANIHQGERIIPAADNRELLARLAEPKANSTDTEIVQLREENRAQAAAFAGFMSRCAKVLEKWEGDGMPETRAYA